MRTQATCFVQEGDLPIAIHWERNGITVKATSNIRITKVDDLTTILVIDKASTDHSGNYTCVASNAAKAVAASATLVVQGTKTLLYYFFCFIFDWTIVLPVVS